MVKPDERITRARYQKIHRAACRKEFAGIGLRLKLWRIGHKLTQTEMGARLKMSQPAVSLWETGSAPIDFDRIQRMCPEILEAFEEVPD